MSRPSLDYSENFDNSVSYYFAEVVFKALVLILTMAFSSHIIHGFGSAKAKKTFMGLFFLSMIIVQYYYIIQASRHIPVNRFYTYQEGLIRDSCKESSKGGKASSIIKIPENINPCYSSCINSTYARCLDSNGNEIYKNAYPHYVSKCPLEGASCRYFNGEKIDKYISKTRDCQGGFGAKCTMAQPCHPCDITYIREHQVDRCTQCSGDNDGNCRFVEGVGPYCYVSPGSKDIQPCKKCCSEPEPVVIDGVCY